MSGLIYPLNNKEYTAEDVEIFNCTRTSGVYSVLDFDYTLSGYSMTIGKGLAWIKNSDFSGKAIAFKEPEELTFEEPHESLERYDVVAIRFDADTQDAQLVIVKGEPSESPRLPPRSTFAWEYELFLYSILRKPSDYNISSDNITDLREDEAYCGIMRDSVTSGVAPLQEVIVENANLKQGDFIDFDANKYTHLVATVNTNMFSCDVVLSKMIDTFGIGRVGFTGMTSMYPLGDADQNIFFMGAQIEGKTTENRGHHIQQISFSDKPEFVGEDFSGMVSISKIVGVCERPEGYVKVDSLYNAESNNAQSGTAVAKAIEDAVKVASDNAKDLITESVDPHFIGDSERAQSGVAVSEALESKQDRLFAGWNIKTINHETLLGSGDVTIDFSEDIDKTNDKLKRLAESIDLNTLDGWVCRANVSTDGKWQNVNASVLSTYVSVVPTIPGEKLVISRNAFTKNTYFACLTDFKEPVEGESLMLSSDPVLGKVVKPTENEEYTIPSDTRFIVVSVNGTFNKATPSKFVLGGYDYLSSGRANVKAVINSVDKKNASQEMFDDIDLNTLSKFPRYNGFVTNTGTWGGISDSFQHIIVPVVAGEKLTIDKSANSAAFIACLTDYTEPVFGESLSFSADPTLGKKVAVNAETSYIMPEDCKYLVVIVLYDGMDITPSKFVLGGYDYLASARKNIKSIVANVDVALDESAVKPNDIFYGFSVNTQWENGGFVLTVGSTANDFRHKARKRTDYMSFGATTKITSDGKYIISVAYFEDGVMTKTFNMSEDYNLAELIPPDTTFRLMIRDASDSDLTAITSEEVNSHISITCNGLKNVLNPNVRWCAMGDSITDGWYSYYDETTGENTAKLAQEKGWAFKLAERKNWDVDNKAVGGSGYKFDAGANKSGWQVAQATDFTKYDLVTLAYGVNDWNTQQPLGAMSDDFDFNATPTTICGAMRKTIETIIASNPLCKIVVITPLNCWWHSDISGEETNWALGCEWNGITLEEVFNLEKEVCEYYGIEMIDMTHSSVVNRKNIQTCLLDNVHPTADTHTVIARELGAKILFN